jgi:hypothetical protein
MRRSNRGSFRPGPDGRRHIFTRAERRLGYARAMQSTLHAGWDLHDWLFRRVRTYYRARRREAARA